MKTINLKSKILLTLLLVGCSCDDIINGSGNIIEQSRELESFDKISNHGVFNVQVAQGNSQILYVKADDNIINDIHTQVSNGQLNLSLDDDQNYHKIDVTIKIVVPKLTEFINQGTGNILLYEINQPETFWLKNEGTSNISLSGSAANLTMQNDGSGRISGFGFLSEDCNISLIGSGDVELSCNTTLTVKIDGSGDVFYKGAPSVNSEIKGSGEIINSN